MPAGWPDNPEPPIGTSIVDVASLGVVLAINHGITDGKLCQCGAHPHLLLMGLNPTRMSPGAIRDDGALRLEK